MIILQWVGAQARLKNGSLKNIRHRRALRPWGKPWQRRLARATTPPQTQTGPTAHRIHTSQCFRVNSLHRIVKTLSAAGNALHKLKIKKWRRISGKVKNCSRYFYKGRVQKVRSSLATISEESNWFRERFEKLVANA